MLDYNDGEYGFEVIDVIVSKRPAPDMTVLVFIADDQGFPLHQFYAENAFEAGRHAQRWINTQHAIGNVRAHQIRQQRFANIVADMRKELTSLQQDTQDDIDRARYGDLWVVWKRSESGREYVINGIAVGKDNSIALAEELAQKWFPDNWMWNGKPGEQLVRKDSFGGEPTDMGMAPAHELVKLRLRAVDEVAHETED